MAAPSVQTVVIQCPACGTRYQLAREALGSRRMVKCAHCQNAWEASVGDEPSPPPTPAEPPPEDQMFDPAEERKLDAAFEAEERAGAASADAEPVKPLADIVAAIAPKPKSKPAPDLAALTKRRLRAFADRQHNLNSTLPMARFRKTARQVSFVALVAVLASGLAFRGDLVRQFPDLAGAFAAIGLGVNIVGLEFRDVKTLKVLRDGSEMLMVSALVVSVADHVVVVPPVVVTLLDAGGHSVYEWSVTPDARDLAPGESVSVETHLARPPGGASGVRLTFTGSTAQLAPKTPTVSPEHPA